MTLPRRENDMSYQARMTEPDPTPPRQRPLESPIYDAQRLVGTQGIATIVLNDQFYTLRITRAGKLILTK